MACIRKRRGKWVVDYRDAAGIRRWATFETRRAAEIFLAAKLEESRQPIQPVVDPDITVARYADHWLSLIASSVKIRTLSGDQQTLRLHVLPALGTVKVRQLAEGRVKALLAAKLASGLSKNSVRIVLAVARGTLSSAVDDQVILANPADRLGRQFRLAQRAADRQEEIKALTREQLTVFLRAAAERFPGFAVLFLLMARTGLRLGEALALQWGDINFHDREIRVVRGFSAGRLETPKSNHGRSVDLSQQVVLTLLRLQIERKTQKVKLGWSDLPPWVFCSGAGTPLDASKVDKVFKRVLMAAGFPLHFSPHCLRHTFASLLLQQQESPAYVQRQLGHASIQLTVDTYGKWLPMGNKAAVDRLDDQSGSKMVATRGFEELGVVEVPEYDGAGGGS